MDLVPEALILDKYGPGYTVLARRQSQLVVIPPQGQITTAK